MAALYTSADLICGSLVLQDEEDEAKFYYFPYEAKGVVSGKDFTGSYWGISYMPYFVGVLLDGFNDFCKDSLLILTEHRNLPVPKILLPRLKNIGFEAYKEACAKQGWPWDEKNKNLSEGM